MYVQARGGGARARRVHVCICQGLHYFLATTGLYVLDRIGPACNVPYMPDTLRLELRVSPEWLAALDDARGYEPRASYVKRAVWALTQLNPAGSPDAARVAQGDAGRDQDQPAGSPRRSGNGPKPAHVAKGQSAGRGGATPPSPAHRSMTEMLADEGATELPKVAKRR
jgi:hypothetical protein